MVRGLKSCLSIPKKNKAHGGNRSPIIHPAYATDMRASGVTRIAKSIAIPNRYGLIKKFSYIRRKNCHNVIRVVLELNLFFFLLLLYN